MEFRYEFRKLVLEGLPRQTPLLCSFPALRDPLQKVFAAPGTANYLPMHIQRRRAVVNRANSGGGLHSLVAAAQWVSPADHEMLGSIPEVRDADDKLRAASASGELPPRASPLTH